MRRLGKTVIPLLLILVLAAGCQQGKGNGKDSATQPAGITILPTHTPTPWTVKEPAVHPVSADSYQLAPLLSGSYEAIWDAYEAIPMETVVKGKGSTKASYKFIWTVDTVYVQVHITDTTPDVSGSNYLKKDSVVFYLNENGEKNEVYSIGDSYCAVDRDGTRYLGTGCDGERFRAVCYEELDENGESVGYYAEAALPLLTVRGKEGMTVGFDVRVNDAQKGALKYALQWSDGSSHTDVNLHGVGLLTFMSAEENGEENGGENDEIAE